MNPRKTIFAVVTLSVCIALGNDFKTRDGKEYKDFAGLVDIGGGRTNSTHYIQNWQPQLVIDSIREVVDAVRDPTSWRRSEKVTAPSGKNP